MGKYQDFGKNLGDLLDSKQEAYGDSFSKAPKILKIIYPNGISLEQYDDMTTLVRMIDKMNRIANKKNAFGEDPFQDLAGYGILAAIRNKENTPFDDLGQPLLRKPENVQEAVEEALKFAEESISKVPPIYDTSKGTYRIIKPRKKKGKK